MMTKTTTMRMTMTRRTARRRLLPSAFLAFAALCAGAGATPPRTVSAQAPSTSLFDLAGLAKALQAAAALAPGKGPWAAREGAPWQTALVARLPESQADLPRIPELQALAALEPQTLDRAVAKAGMSIRLAPWPNDGRHLGVASLLDLRLRWRTAGETHERGQSAAFTVAGGQPAFRLTSADNDIEFGRFRTAPEPVVIVTTQSNDKLFLLRTDAPPADPLALADLGAAIARTRPSHDWEFQGAYLPMVNADKVVDLSWLAGLRLGSWEVAQGRQQVRFQMNQLGVVVQSATEIGVVAGLEPTYYRLDGPFIAVVSRPGVRIPIFCGYIGRDAFGRPELAREPLAAPSSPAAPADDDMDEIYRVGTGAVRAPSLLHKVPPVYTEEARKARLQGVVILECVIDRTGRVVNSKVLKGLPLGLDAAAVAAAEQWRYSPATRNGKPVRVYYPLTVEFNLR